MIAHIKTAILWFLILLSVFLTYQIWTFQPEYAILKTEYIDYTQIGEEKKIQEVIKPRQIVLHVNGNSYSPLKVLTYFESFHEKYSGLTFTELAPSNGIDLDKHEKMDRLQIIFPTSIPIEALKTFYQFDSDEPLFIEKVDEITLFHTDKEGEEQINVKLISYEEQIEVQGETNFPLNKFKDAIQVVDDKQYIEVFPYHINKYNDLRKKVLYLPSHSQQVNSVTYLAKPIAPELFNQALFSDPNFVKHYMQSNGEESFTDGNRMVNVINNGEILRYINPTVGELVDPQTSKDFLFSAVEFLNGHGGLTNSFYYDNKKTIGPNEEIVFRLTIDGIPVYKSNLYSGNNLFELTLSRSGGSQIEQYIRPLFEVEEEPINISRSAVLPSGSSIVKSLLQKEDFNPYLLTDINKGYTMVKRQSFIIFEPSWFIFYNGSWEEIKVVEDVQDSEAISDGLE